MSLRPAPLFPVLFLVACAPDADLATLALRLTEDTKLIASDSAEDDSFGVSVASAGDVDGDGYDDVIVGSYRDDDRGDGAGAAYVYLGTASGVDPASESKLIALDGHEGANFGVSVGGGGDVDGDGYDDVVVGAYKDDGQGSSAGAAYVYFGSAAGIDPLSMRKLMASTGSSSDYFGRSVTVAGDVDGDGYDDLAVGAHGADLGGSNVTTR
jgi:hypothetical protein